MHLRRRVPKGRRNRGPPTFNSSKYKLYKWRRYAPPKRRMTFSGLQKTEIFMKISIFWDITPCSSLKVNRCFGGTYCLYLQGRKISRARNQRENRWRAKDSTLYNHRSGYFITCNFQFEEYYLQGYDAV
jgi:hypothetical protein